MDFVPVMKKENVSPQKPSQTPVQGERRVKCSSCLKEFGVPDGKNDFFCVHCGKKHSQKGQQPAQELGKKGDKRIISLDTLIGKGAKVTPSAGGEPAPDIVTTSSGSKPIHEAKAHSGSESGRPVAPEPGIKRLSEIEETTSGPQEEYIEQCQCPVCSTIVAADAASCPACGVQFAGEDEVEEPQKPKEQRPLNVCSTCGKLVPDVDKLYTCKTCNKTFCDNCPSPHIPPEAKSLEAKVVYKYKLKTQTVWTSDAVKFTENILNPMCKKCYMGEYDKAFLRLRSKVKQWEIDIRRDADAKVMEEIFPERKEVTKTKKVIPATDFLKWVART